MVVLLSLRELLPEAMIYVFSLQWMDTAMYET